MGKKLLIILIYFLCLISVLEAQNTNMRFGASACVLPPEGLGVTNAEIVPMIVKSNAVIRIMADVDSIATNVKVFFNNSSITLSLVTNNSPYHWQLDIQEPFKNQAYYTAGFMVILSNKPITNYNMTYYAVDNTPPDIMATSPYHNEVTEFTDWNFLVTFQDSGDAGLDANATISNSSFIYSGADQVFGTMDDLTNNGTWNIISATEIEFIPVKPTEPGQYRFISFAVDQVGNTNYNMLSTNNYITFKQDILCQIYYVRHRFRRHTQLTPGVPLKVSMKASPGNTAYFKVLGTKNITNVQMNEVKQGIYEGTYIIQKNDYVRDGIVRGYLQGQYILNYKDAAIKIDIGRCIRAKRGRDIIIVSKHDIETRILIPDKALKEDVTLEIDKLAQFGDRIAYDFNMKTYQSGVPVEFFEKPLTMYIHYTVKNKKVEKLNLDEDKLEKNTSLFFFDRVKWIKLGGTIDTKEDVIYAEVKHFSVFALAIDDTNGELVVWPNPFTPNEDFDFDKLHFSCDILSGEPDKAEIKIFTLAGHLRRTLTLEQGTLNNGTVDIMWDAKDEAEQDCAPGLYVFQALIGNKRYNGTFVLAR